MALATLTTKGQVTVPKKVRDSLHLRAGDKLEFIVTKDGRAILKPVTKKVDDVFGSLYRAEQKPVSVKEMNDSVKRSLRKAAK